MNRRAFLARSLRIPAAVAALPFVGGLATLAGATEPEAQTEATLLEPQMPALVGPAHGALDFIEPGLVRIWDAGNRMWYEINDGGAFPGMTAFERHNQLRTLAESLKAGGTAWQVR
ncbi:MAG TPA: hypothetical protein VGP33_16915 [Chloroflexota bacterium]|jgi:hypothetical protein|nr:hypothetical protein [Chloroflexota bacterium]